MLCSHCTEKRVSLSLSLAFFRNFVNVKRASVFSWQECPEKKGRERQEEKKRRKLGRKFMRHRRELLLLNKTLKYLITVPVISVPKGSEIGAVCSAGFGRARHARIEQTSVSRYAVLTAFANFWHGTADVF